MNSKLFFLLIACASVSFTIIVICNGPVIQSFAGISGIENCQEKHDNYDNIKSGLSKEEKKPYLREIHRCERYKAMYGLEYASLIMDIFFGFVCALLGLLNYFGAAKSFEKIIGLIGLISGVICFIMTLIYICYNGYIFTNDTDETIKIDKDGLFAELNDNNYYDCKYFDKDDLNAIYAKFNELGKKQYNYNKDIYFENQKDEVSECTISKYDFFNDVIEFCSSSTQATQKNAISSRYDIPKKYDSNNSDVCKKLYFDIKSNSIISKRYYYDRWVTSIIFGVFVIACNIGLALFGFLIFKDGGSSDHTPIS